MSRKRYDHSRIDLARSRDGSRDCIVATDGLLNDPPILGLENGERVIVLAVSKEGRLAKAVTSEASARRRARAWLRE
jgi:hypothetical protein